MTNFADQSALIASLTNLFLAVFVLTKSPRSAIHRTFGFLSFLLFLWNLGAVFGQPQFIYVAASFLPVGALHFTMRFIGERGHWTSIKLCYVLSALFAVLGLQEIIQPMTLKYLLTLYLTPVVLLILLRLYKKRSHTTGRLERLQLNYLFIGSSVAVICGVTDFLASLGLHIPKLGSLGSLLYVVIIAVAIVRYRLLNVHLLIGRSIILLAFTFLIWTLSGIAGNWWTGNLHNSFFAILVATVLLLIVYEPAKGLIERQTDRVLKHQSLEFLNQLNRLSRELAAVISLNDLARTLSATFKRTTKIKRFSLYLRPDQRTEFNYIQGNVPPPEKLKSIPPSSALPQQLQLQKIPLDREELQRELQLWLLPDNRQRMIEVVRTLSGLGANLCVPLIHQDELLGFIALGTLEGEEGAFLQREKDLLTAVGNQAAVSFANASIYERMKQNDRLIALGEMAAGLAHEIRNPLGAIKAAAQFIDSGGSQADHHEFLSIIIEEVNRLNDVVTRFLDYARPLNKKHSLVDLNEIITKMIDFLQPKCRDLGVETVLTVSSTPAVVMGEADELKQLCFNLFGNAFEAMSSNNGGMLQVTTEIEAAGREEPSIQLPDGATDAAQFQGWVCMIVQDTGSGIAAENLDKLFNPFYTTKAHGAGLGLAIVHKIIEGHNGAIQARNGSAGGAEFIVRLPYAGNHESETNAAELPRRSEEA